MPVETIGEFGTPGASREWAAQAALAVQRIVENCRPPPEMELEVEWQEHELGSYQVLVLILGRRHARSPAKYISKCQNALFEFEYGEPPPDMRPWMKVFGWSG
jgi:hypothetical protein